jgi:hypothetical protein
MRDIKRWTTAIASAKQGLYIFGNLDMLNNSSGAEVKDVLSRITTRPSSLGLALDGSMNTSPTVVTTEDMMAVLQTEIQKELRKTRI